MSIALVSHAAYTGGANGGTSASMNSTGANLLVLELSAYTGLTSAVTAANISDTYGNTWVPQISLNPGSGNVQVYTCANPVVGTGHTVSITKTNIFISFAVQAWSGVDNTTGLAAHNSNTIASGSPTTIQPGSVTPAVNHCLVISNVYLDNNVNSASIDSGFTISDAVPFTSGTCEGMTAAYLLQSPAAAVDPTWTLSSAASSAGTASWIGVYQPAAGGPAVIPAPGVFPLIGLSTLGWIIERRNLLKGGLLALLGAALVGSAAAQSITPGPGGSGTVTGVSSDCSGSGSGVIPIICTKTNGSAFGTAAVVNTGTSGATLPLLNAANTWSGAQTHNSGDLVLAGSGSGSTTLNAAAAASGVLTLPAATDQLVGRATTDTLTNKTLTSPTLTTPSLGVATATSINFGGGALSTFAQGAWTPTDNSGAGLTFTAVKASYTQIGNQVIGYFTVTYPTTADASNASIAGLPVAAGSTNFGGGGGTCLGNNVGGVPLEFFIGSGTTGTLRLLTNSANVTNANLSTAPMRCNFQYTTL